MFSKQATACDVHGDIACVNVFSGAGDMFIVALSEETRSQ